MVLGVTQRGGLVVVVVVYVDLSFSWQPLGPLSPGKPVIIDVTLVLQDPSESVFWAGFKGLNTS